MNLQPSPHYTQDRNQSAGGLLSWAPFRGIKQHFFRLCQGCCHSSNHSPPHQEGLLFHFQSWRIHGVCVCCYGDPAVIGLGSRTEDRRALEEMLVSICQAPFSSWIRTKAWGGSKLHLEEKTGWEWAFGTPEWRGWELGHPCPSHPVAAYPFNTWQRRAGGSSVEALYN